MQYNQYLETGLLLLYYVLPLFRGGPDSQYIEKFNDSYQAVPVHMHQENIAKHLAGFVVLGSAESEMDWEKGWENKQQKSCEEGPKEGQEKSEGSIKGKFNYGNLSGELIEHTYTRMQTRELRS